MTTPDSYLSYFSPGQMSHETLEFILVKRQKLAERLVERVKNSVLTGAKHQSLLLGPRGMGKSHLVALVYYRVKALPELAEKTAFAWLAEEEWGIASLMDLFLVILKALAREYPESGLQAEINALYRLPLDQISDTAAQTIRDFVGGERTLFLLMENMEEIFKGLGSDGQWAFRSFLSEHPFVTILASTPSLFVGIQKQEQAFYGFFQQTYLEELTAAEAVELLGKVAERRGDTRLSDFLKTPVALDRIQAVHDLAGGHPRIYLLFAHLITDETLDELVSPFLQLLDELTPYYQSRMQLLSPQQRKIVEYLCDRRGAVTVKEIAAGNLLKPQLAAAQLGELEKMRYVRKTAVGRESYYELFEPLLRMVIEMKRGRGEPIRLVVDFLRRWYSRDERRERLAMVPLHAVLTKQHLEAALDLNLAMLDTPNPERAASLSTVYEKAYYHRDFTRVAEIAAEIIERKGSNCTALDWLLYANGLYSASEYDKSLRICKKSLCMAVDEAAISRTWTLQGMIFVKLARSDEAKKCFNKAIEVDPKNPLPYYKKGGISLAEGDWTGFIQMLRRGLEAAASEGRYISDTYLYCCVLLEQEVPGRADRIAEIVMLYAEHKALVDLELYLTLSLVTLIKSCITQERAEEWLVTWTSVGEGKPELAIGLRLLAAAVAWKHKHDVRALLALPIEERRILESLLPKEDEAATASSQ